MPARSRSGGLTRRGYGQFTGKEAVVPPLLGWKASQPATGAFTEQQAAAGAFAEQQAANGSWGSQQETGFEA